MDSETWKLTKGTKTDELLPSSMIMIAFHTLQDSFVSFMEVLSSWNPCGFEFLELRLHLLLFSLVKRKKRVFHILSRRPVYVFTFVLRTHIWIYETYLHVYFVHIYEYIRIYTSWDLVHPDASGSPRCLIPTVGLTFKYSTCAVCVCPCVAYTRTYTYTATSIKNIDNTLMYPSECPNNLQQQVPCINRFNPFGLFQITSCVLSYDFSVFSWLRGEAPTNTQQDINSGRIHTHILDTYFLIYILSFFFGFEDPT